MKILEKVEIEEYRGLKKFWFSPNSINIIVGPNNTGKSSILEAVSIFAASPNKFKDVLDNTIFNELIKVKEYKPSYLIYLDAQRAKIQGEISGKKYAIEIMYSPKGLPKDERSELIFDYFNEYADSILNRYTKRTYGIEYEKLDKILAIVLKDLSPEKINFGQVTLRKYFREYLRDIKNRSEIKEELDKLIRQEVAKKMERIRESIMNDLYNSEKILITISNKDLEGLYVYFPEELEEEIFFNEDRFYFHLPSGVSGLYPIHNFEPKELEEFPIIFNFQKSAFASNVKSLYDSVVSKGKIINTIDLIKDKIPYIQDIRKTEDDIYVFTSQAREPVPLSVMGDGFIALLKISFLISLAENGILVLEEPEVSLHPGFLDIIAEEIVNNSNLVQFFVSTHSLDLLNLTLEKAKEKRKLNEINIIRLHRREDISDIYPEVLTGDEAKEEIEEIGTDLRYT